MRLALAAALLAAAASIVPARAADVPPGVVLTRDVPYGPLPEQKLTICRPAEVPETTRLPGVILIHGGAWVALDKDTVLYACGAMAREGLVAVTIDYRPADEAKPSTLWPAQLADAQLAVRWMRAKAGTIGLDPARLCAYGESAGGHLAVFLAALPTIEPTDMASLYAEEAVSVECAVDNFGPVDLADPGIRTITEPLIGRPLRHNMAAFQRASPLFYIGKTTAPIFIEQGSADKVVPSRQSSRLLNRLTRAGVKTFYMLYPGGHQWQRLNNDEREFMAVQERDFLRTFLKAKPPH